ncbi:MULTISPECIES: hypothetical protein [Haloprofundus]|nr:MULTISPECIES: hypothetical protein [Haloprofundus]
MTQFECTECGQLGRFGRFDESTLTMRCPVCEEQTVWTVAFADEGGVSF